MVDLRAHRVQALLAIFLLMAMHSPFFRVQAYRVQLQFVAGTNIGQSRKRSAELAEREMTNSSESFRSDAAQMKDALATTSPVCEAFFEMSAYFAGKARLLNMIFDTYSCSLITHHAVHVWNFLQGYGVDTVAVWADTIIGSFNLWLGSLWVSIDVVKGACEKTLGTCVGIVNLIFLLVSAVFICIFFFPVFCAAIAAHAGLAGLTTWLGTHMGHMVLSILLFVWRKAMRNICSVIEGGRIALSKIFEYMRSEASEIVSDWKDKTGTTFTMSHFLETLTTFEGRMEALNVARSSLERQMLELKKMKQIHDRAWNATTKSWQFAMSGMSLTKDNLKSFVDDDEIVITPRRGVSVTFNDSKVRSRSRIRKA